MDAWVCFAVVFLLLVALERAIALWERGDDRRHTLHAPTKRLAPVRLELPVYLPRAEPSAPRRDPDELTGRFQGDLCATGAAR